MTEPLAMFAAVVLALAAVFVHYEALNLLNRISSRLGRHRTTLLAVMCGLLIAHVVEIWVFGMGYAVGIEVLRLGTLTPGDLTWFDYGYFSAMVFTTVGFGDIIPTGGLRMIAAAEALTGLALITWSASYTFLHMRRLWED